MRNATKVTVSTFGVIAGLAGIEHGIGEILQGSEKPAGILILSWPETAFYRIYSGEPAMTILPNLLLTGILAVLASLVFIVWATLFIDRKKGGLVLILLSIVMLLMGAGFGPPLVGFILGAAATRINKPLAWWRRHLSLGMRRVLSKLWPWCYGAALIAWLLLFPGLGLFDIFLGVNNAAFASSVILAAFGLLLLTIVAGFAYDIQRQTSSQLPE
jgi:hypothetical protein